MKVLFLVVDSLRADALGCYGGAGDTPTVDRLASDGARFDSVVSSAPWTLPSLAAMLTGVWSYRLGLLKWEQPWPKETPTLFDACRGAGLEVASFVFDPEHLFCACPEAGVVGSSQDSEALLGWFREHRHGNYFAFVHYWWTHVPYLRRKLPLATWNTACTSILALLSASNPSEREANRKRVRGLYALAVHEFSELWLPPLLAAAQADVVVIVADHGESWGERLPSDRALEDVFDLHGNHLHDEVMRVPWIVHAPGLVKPTVVRGLARSVDITPTLKELLGLDRASPTGGQGSSVPGRSLVSALESGRIHERLLAFGARNRDFVDAPVVPTDAQSAYEEFMVRSPNTKTLLGWGANEEREYDLAKDPGEWQARAVSNPSSLAEALRSEMRAATVAPFGEEGFPLLQQQLRSLGYL